MKTAPPAEAFISHVNDALSSGTFVRLLLSKPRDEPQTIQRIIGRIVSIQGKPNLSLTVREPKRDTTQNISLDEVTSWLNDQIATQFQTALLETTSGDWQFTINTKGKARLIAHKARTKITPTRTHDRQKRRLLDDPAIAWLTALGLCDQRGNIRPSSSDKYHQLERYLEIVRHAVGDCGWSRGEQIHIVDMGCGKGYLTFGVWHLLNRTLNLTADVTGVEARRELVDQANDIAQAVGANSLKFVTGDIASAKLDKIDGLIALHACNTATDDAIARGTHAGARLIIVSPCCHQELRPQLGHPTVLKPLLRYGLLEERFSEWLTDGLRTLRLEEAGYATKVIEFVASEHTPRNLLITAVRKKASIDTSPMTERIRALKEFFDLADLASDRITPR